MDDLKPITEIDVLPLEAMVSIKISGVFYKRLQNCLFAHVASFDGDQATATIKLQELQTRQPINYWEEQAVLLLGLVYAIDTSAAEQGLIKKDDIKHHIKQDPSEEASPES
jgi:hypothetical protein